MHTGDEMPVVDENASLSEALLEMSRKGLGMTAVVDGQGKVTGIFTDGDLRRALDQKVDVHKATIRQMMTVGGKSARPGILAAEALHMMEEFRINALLIVDDKQRLLGVLNMHDLLRAGVV